MLRQRKQNDHCEQTLPSEKEQLINDKTAQNVHTKEMQMIEQWEPLKKELVDAELLLVPRPGAGFKRYKEHLWPDNVRVYGKLKNNGNGVIVKVYFEGKDEYDFWKKLRKEPSFMDDVLFAFSKWSI